VTACACCFKSCFAKCGPFVALAIAAMLSAGATLAILWRATYEDNLLDSTADVVNDGSDNWIAVQNFRSFQFLYTYWVELLLVWFFHYPLMATLFFSGSVWSCLPCIGGRPKEIQRQEVEAKSELGSVGTRSIDEEEMA